MLSKRNMIFLRSILFIFILVPLVTGAGSAAPAASTFIQSKEYGLNAAHFRLNKLEIKGAIPDRIELIADSILSRWPEMQTRLQQNNTGRSCIGLIFNLEYG